MPSCLCSSFSAFRADLRVFLSIRDKLWRAMNRHMVGLRGKDGNVLGSVVGLVMVQVMDALGRQKVSPQPGLGYKAMLIDIPVSVRGGIVWCIHVHVPALVDKAPTFPSGAVWPLETLSSMASAISVMLPSADATFRVAGCGDGRDLTATTHAQSRGVRGLLDLPAGAIHLFGRFGPGPVASDVAMPFGNLCTTTA